MEWLHAMTKANTRYEYLIRRDVTFRTGGERYLVVKADAKTSEPVEFYNVVRVQKRGHPDQYELHCSCPAYKAVCKHHHMVNAFRLARDRDKTGKKVAAAIFNPSDSSLALTYDELDTYRTDEKELSNAES